MAMVLSLAETIADLKGKKKKLREGHVACLLDISDVSAKSVEDKMMSTFL